MNHPIQMMPDGTFQPVPVVLTKRELFAAKILAGFASNPSIFAEDPSCGWHLVNCTDDQLAEAATMLADSLISHLEKSE